MQVNGRCGANSLEPPRELRNERAGDEIPGSCQIDAIARRYISHDEESLPVLPQELIGLIGVHLPVKEAARSADGSARFQTTSEILTVASSALGAPISEFALQQACAGKEKELLSHAIEMWLPKMNSPFVLPQSLQLADLTFLQPLFKKMPIEQLHSVLQALVRAIPAMTTLDLSEITVWPATLMLLQALPQLTSLSVNCQSTSHFIEIGKLIKLTKLKLNAEHGYNGDRNSYTTGMQYLCHLTNLMSLDMQGYYGLSDVGIAHLQKLGQLRHLRLSRCENIGDMAVQALLTSLSNLQSLELNFCTRITDAALTPLCHMKYLQNVHLKGCTGVTDAGIQLLPSTLCTLDLEGLEGITPAGFSALATLRSLTSLNLSSTRVDDEALAHLSELVHLQHLQLGPRHGSNSITGSGFQYLSKLTSLVSLGLRSANRLTAEGLAYCAQFTALQELDLSWVEIPRGGLAGLRGLSHLRHLNFYQCRTVTDAELAYIADLTSLQELNLSKASNITDSGLQHLAKLNQLRKLDLQETKATAAGMQYLAGLTELENLNLTWCPITDEGLRHLAGLHKLQILELSWCGQLTGSGFVHLTKLKMLHELWLNGCKNLTGAVVEPLGECTALKTLMLSYCENIPNMGRFLVKLINLEYISIGNSSIGDSEMIDCSVQLPALKTIDGYRTQHAIKRALANTHPHLEVNCY